MADIKQPALHGQDKAGNVRPADDRFLTKADQRKRDAYVTKVEESKADAKAAREVAADPLADVLSAAVARALGKHAPAEDVPPAEPDQEGPPHE